MKIAIPVKMNKDNSAIAPLFGKAKWFAIIEDDKIMIEKNPAEGGRGVIEWLHQIHVDTIIIQEMGQSPYNMIQKLGGIKIYHSGFERMTLKEALEKFDQDALPILDETGMLKIIAHHEGKHSHGNHGHEHHHHT
jgi:predicted Fe-Mo cluster-binding NifX family protein